MATEALRNYTTDAIRYWEPKCLIYNAVLTTIVLTHFVLNYPASKAALSINTVLFVFLLAVMANVFYCAAYIVDIFAQLSGYCTLWKKHRWMLFATGVAFAGVITHFFASAIPSSPVVTP